MRSGPTLPVCHDGQRPAPTSPSLARSPAGPLRQGTSGTWGAPMHGGCHPSVPEGCSLRVWAPGHIPI